MLDKIDPVILAVNRFEECVNFYKDKLGLVEIHREKPPDQFVTFNLGGDEFSLHGGYEGKKDGPISIYFLTSDIDDEVARLKGQGVKIVKSPERFSWGWLAVVEDPDGNEIGIYQR
jgi:predicted enzyme related to lactoylglutathione lyase